MYNNSDYDPLIRRSALIPDAVVYGTSRSAIIDDSLSQPSLLSLRTGSRSSISGSGLPNEITDDILIERSSLTRTIVNTNPLNNNALLRRDARDSYSQVKSDIDWSTFDYKNDPYYIEKREQLKSKTASTASMDDIVNENLSYDQKLRAVAEQLRELEKGPQIVDSVLTTRFEKPSMIRLSSGLTFNSFDLAVPQEQKVLKKKSKAAPKPVIESKKVSNTSVNSSSEDPYDKYNKNPIGNIVGKRAQRIKQQLAQKKADAEKQDDDIVVAENCSESIVPDSSTGLGEETSFHQKDTGGINERARSSSFSEVTSLEPDSSTDNVCVPSVSSTGESDIVDSTTPEIQYLAQQQRKSESSSSAGSKEYPIEISNEEPEEQKDDTKSSNEQTADDDGMLAMFLREQRESVKSEPNITKPQASTKVPFSLKRIPTKSSVLKSLAKPGASIPTLTRTTGVKPSSSLKKFQGKDRSDFQNPVRTLSLPDPLTIFPETPRFALDPMQSFGPRHSPVSSYNTESSTSWLSRSVEHAQRSRNGEVDVQARLRREQEQAEEEMRRRESSSGNQSMVTKPPDPLSVLNNMWNGLTNQPMKTFSPLRTSASLDPYTTIKTSEQRRIIVERELERKRLLKEEQKALKEAMELEKRREIERRLETEIANERERERKRLLAEQQKLLELKRKEEDELRRRLEEERKERERIERERKIREQREKERRQNEDLKLKRSLIEVYNLDMHDEFTGSMDTEVKKQKNEKFSGNTLHNCKCFENFDAFDISGIGKSVTITPYHIFSEDISMVPLAGNFDDEILIRDIDTAIQVARESVFDRRLKKFLEILKGLPDDYLEFPEETCNFLDVEWKEFSNDTQDDEQDLSDSELLGLVESMKAECLEMKQKLKLQAEEVEKRKALLAAKMEEKAKLAEKARLEEKARKAALKNSAGRESKSSKCQNIRDSSTLSISTVMRRNPDDQGTIVYEPEKRKPSQNPATKSGSNSSFAKTSSSLSDFIKEAGFKSSESSMWVKQDRESPPPMGIPIPPPNMFPTIVPPPSDMYSAAAASFAALNFQRFGFNESSLPFADTISKIGGVTIVPVDARRQEREQRRQKSPERSPQRTKRSHVQRRGRSRSRSLSSSDFKLPLAAEKPIKKSRVSRHQRSDSDFSSHSRSPKYTKSSSSSHHRKHKKEKSKRDHKVKHRKSKKKSKKESKSKRRESSSKLKKRIKKEPFDPDEATNSKIFINPHHENFKRFYSAKEESSKVTQVRAISLSSESSYTSSD